MHFIAVLININCFLLKLPIFCAGIQYYIECTINYDALK